MSMTKIDGRQLSGLGGDVTGTGDAVTVVKLQGTPVSASAPTPGDSLVFNGTDWAPAAGGGGSVGGSGALGQVAYWSSGTDITGNASFTFSPATGLSVVLPASASPGSIVLTAGSNNSAGVGGVVAITAGASDGFNDGASVTIKGGASSTTSSGGHAYLIGGDSIVGGPGGVVRADGGNGTTGGNVFIAGGSGGIGGGGDVNIRGGNNNGRVYIWGGNNATTGLVQLGAPLIQLNGTAIELNAPVKIVDGTQGSGKVLTSDGSGNASWQTPTGGGISGSGTTGKLPKWTGSTALGDSIVSESAGAIGIGRAPGGAPDGPFLAEFNDLIAVVGDGVTTSALIRLAGYGNSGGALSFYEAGGTELAPTSTQAGDQMGFIGAKGYDGTQFSATGSRIGIQMFAAENFTPTAQGTFMRFRVTAPGTVANTVALTLKAAATGQPRAGFGTTNPQATVDVSGSFKLADGTEGASKVLTSDGSGNASWQTPSGGSADFNRIVTAGGNVVVGNDGNVVFI